MKPCFWLVGFGLLFALGAEAAEPDAEALDSKINKVTVYSDRAQVTRNTEVSVSPGTRVLAFRKLPGWVDDGSVRLSLTPPDLARIVDVRVKRDYLARAESEEYQKAEAAVSEVAARVVALDDELQVLAAQARQIEAIRAFSLAKVSKETTLGDVKIETYGKVVNFIGDSLRDTAKRRRAIEADKKELMPELAARQRRLVELKGLTQLEETSVYVTLKGHKSGQASLDLTYMLPGATWEPTHELRAMGKQPKSAEVSSFAVVTQTSGEDWENAELAFATQSSTESIRIPELEALTLGDTHTATRVMKSRASSFSRAQKAFVHQNRMWNKMNSKERNFEQTYSSNFTYLQTVQSKSVEIFRSLQKRGTTAHFTGQKGRFTVRGDGGSVRIPIGKTNLDATPKIVAAPEQSLNAARTLEMVNVGKQALLPGKVSLYQDGAFLGMTDMRFIAAGERFAVYLGVADRLKLSRFLDKKLSTLVRKRNNRMQLAFVVTVENLGDEPTTLELGDRIPVSENKAIKIDKVSVTGGATPNNRGLLKWGITLAPKEKRTFKIAYRIEYPPTLILQTRQAPHPAAGRAQKSRRFDFSDQDISPAADAPIENQIMNLEKEF